MPEKDPSTYGLITYLWVTGLAAWGGLVSFYRKVKSGETRVFNVVELIGEIATSAFAGLITFWLRNWRLRLARLTKRSTRYSRWRRRYEDHMPPPNRS